MKQVLDKTIYTTISKLQTNEAAARKQMG